MKFSHEYATESQARTRELALQAQGYAAWSKHKADDTWQVYWMPRN